AIALEQAHRIDTVAFDKTGTLTLGKPQLVEVRAVETDRNSLLRLAAAVQAGSEHPLAKAVLEAARHEQIPISSASQVRALPGRGIEATVDGHALSLGNTRLMNELGIDLSSCLEAAQTLQAQGRTVSWLASGRPDGQASLLGLLAFGD